MTNPLTETAGVMAVRRSNNEDKLIRKYSSITKPKSGILGKIANN